MNFYFYKKNINIKISNIDWWSKYQDISLYQYFSTSLQVTLQSHPFPARSTVLSSLTRKKRHGKKKTFWIKKRKKSWANTFIRFVNNAAEVVQQLFLINFFRMIFQPFSCRWGIYGIYMEYTLYIAGCGTWDVWNHYLQPLSTNCDVNILRCWSVLTLRRKKIKDTGFWAYRAAVLLPTGYLVEFKVNNWSLQTFLDFKPNIIQWTISMGKFWLQFLYDEIKLSVWSGLQRTNSSRSIFPCQEPIESPSEEHKCCLFWVQCSLKPQLWLLHKHPSFQGHSGRTLSRSIHRALRPLKRFSPTPSGVQIDWARWTNPDLAPWTHKAKVDHTLRRINYRSPVAFFLQGKMCNISPPTLHNKVIRRSTSVQQEQQPLCDIMSPEKNITDNGPQQEMKTADAHESRDTWR